jgi:ABC-type amino acid transport substrate-binding protein
MKRIVLLTLSIFLAMCLAVQAGEIDRIKAKGHIVVSLNKGYPPFCMEVNNELTGLDVDLAKLSRSSLSCPRSTRIRSLN